MKKIFPLILLAILSVAAWFFSAGKSPRSTTPLASEGGSVPLEAVRDNMISDINKLDSSGSSGTTTADGDIGGPGDMLNADGETKPAAQFYPNAAEALKAIQAGSRDYDDMILEQFTLPGEDCTWCPELYKSVKDLLGDQALAADQRSY